MPNFVQTDERDPNVEPKCYLWGQIWSILDLWPLAAILDFTLTDKFLLKLVSRVKKYVHAKFCPNLMNGIQMPSRNVICGLTGSNLVDFGPLTTGGHLEFCKKWEILAQACLKGQVVCPCQVLSKSDERDPNAEPKCDLWGDRGKIWSIWTFDPWWPSWILR